MATKSSSRIHFEAKASRAMNGIALVFDLEGFSAFFNQPDVHNYVPRYLNHVLEAVTRCYAGGDIYWADDPNGEKLEAPIHQKFMGDGGLYVWIPPASDEDFSQDF